MNLFTKQKQTHRHRSKLTVVPKGGTQRRETRSLGGTYTPSTHKADKQQHCAAQGPLLSVVE